MNIENKIKSTETQIETSKLELETLKLKLEKLKNEFNTKQQTFDKCSQCQNNYSHLKLWECCEGHYVCDTCMWGSPSQCGISHCGGVMCPKHTYRYERRGYATLTVCPRHKKYCDKNGRPPSP